MATFLGQTFNAEEYYKKYSPQEYEHLQKLREGLAQRQQYIAEGRQGNWADQVANFQGDIDYYLKGKRYQDAMQDWKIQLAGPKAKELGLTPMQLITNPQLAEDPRALAQYTGQPYVEPSTGQKTDYTPGSEDWYKLNPQERPGATTAPTPTPSTTPGLGQKIEGFPQSSNEMEEWQKKYTFDSGTGSWYEKGAGTTTSTTPTLETIQKGIQDVTAQIPSIEMGIKTLQQQAGTTTPTTGTGTTTPQETGGLTPEQAEQQQREQLMNQIQGILDSGQQGSTGAITGTVTPPAIPSYETDFEAMRDKYAVEPLETELGQIDKEINNLRALYEGAISQEKGRMAPMATIRQRQSVISQEQAIELDRLTRQKIAVQEQLNNKYNIINTMMELKQMDYQTARSNYEWEYNKAVQAQQLLASQEDKQKSNAMATLNTVVNMLSNAGLSWDEISLEQQTAITREEMLAGIPSGTMQAFMSAKPKAELISSVNNYDAQGNAITTLIYNDGGNIKTSVVQTGGFKEPKDTTTTTTKNMKYFPYTVDGRGASFPVDVSNITTGTIEQLRKLGAKDADIRAWLETNTSPKLNKTTIDSLLEKEKVDTMFSESWWIGMYGEKEGKKYFQEYGAIIEQYRKAGYTNEQILKMMQ